MFAGEVDLDKWYKPNIDKKALKEFSKRSDLKGITDIFLFIVSTIFFASVFCGLVSLFFLIILTIATKENK